MFFYIFVLLILIGKKWLIIMPMYDVVPHKFIALDLETTWLSPEKDTILEIACIWFELQRNVSHKKWEAIHVREKSMLVNPGCSLSDEVSMITGITEAMVAGKCLWSDIREKVRTFIGEDGIIVGHNVLFDISMLYTHGIDLTKSRVLDTFELSEIFSQDAESLNLWFLGKKYGYLGNHEHRALEDTRLSLRLFCHYLDEITEMDDETLCIWKKCEKYDSSNITSFLSYICGLSEKSSEDFPLEKYTALWTLEKTSSECSGVSSASLFSFNGSWKDERTVLFCSREHHKKIIVSPNIRESEWLLKEYWSDDIYHIIPYSSFISLDAFWEVFARTSWTRKETILNLKLFFWLIRTDTGDLGELKWYGDEYFFSRFYFLRPWETNIFTKKEKKNREKYTILLTEIRWYREDFFSDPDTDLVIRDIVGFEEVFRKDRTQVIDFFSLYRMIALVETDELQTFFAALRMGIEMYEQILMSVHIRPTWPEVSPPWYYGETYFFSLREFWSRWFRSLILARSMIYENMVQIREYFDRTTTSYWWMLIERDIQKLLYLATYWNDEQGIVLTIQNEKTHIHIVPRSMKWPMHQILSWHLHTDIIGYGVHKQMIEKYLSDELGIHLPCTAIVDSYAPKKIRFCNWSVSPWKMLVLWTNLKHLRELSRVTGEFSWRDFSGNKDIHPKIFTQGISGGKEKIRALFLESNDPTMLFWLLDSWEHDMTIFRVVHTLVITKIPFDPPTDPYYLARTIGMRNNFEQYSLPLALAKLNALISKARMANPEIDIIVSDERVEKMQWGRKILDGIIL